MPGRFDFNKLLDSHFESVTEFKCKICTGEWKEYLDMYLEKALENPHPRMKSDLEGWFKIVAGKIELVTPSSSRVGECLRNHIPEKWSKACGSEQSSSEEGS